MNGICQIQRVGLLLEVQIPRRQNPAIRHADRVIVEPGYRIALSVGLNVIRQLFMLGVRIPVAECQRIVLRGPDQRCVET